MNKICVFSIVSNNYFSQVKILANSVKLVYGSDVDFFVILNDETNSKVDYSCKDFKIILSKDLNIPNFDYYAMKYNVVEFNTFLKPYAFKYFSANYTKMFYIDPDIELFSKLIEAENALNEFPAVLTPHKLKKNEYINPSDNIIFQSGFFNLGFAGFNNSLDALTIIENWCNDLKYNCYNDVVNHKFTDQKSMANLFYYYYDKIYIIKHPGYNYAPWNFDERELFLKDDKIYCKLLGQETLFELRFFHFSGFKVNDSNSFFNTKHAKINIKKNTLLHSLLESYNKKMCDNNFLTYKNIKYVYDYFDNDSYISRFERKVFEFLVSNGYLDKRNNYFSVDSKFYKFLKKNHFLTDNEMKKYDFVNTNNLRNGDYSAKEKMLKLIMKFLRFLIGLKNYLLLMRYLGYASRNDYQMFLVKERLVHEK